MRHDDRCAPLLLVSSSAGHRRGLLPGGTPRMPEPALAGRRKVSLRNVQTALALASRSFVTTRAPPAAVSSSLARFRSRSPRRTGARPPLIDGRPPSGRLLCKALGREQAEKNSCRNREKGPCSNIHIVRSAGGGTLSGDGKGRIATPKSNGPQTVRNQDQACHSLFDQRLSRDTVDESTPGALAPGI